MEATSQEWIVVIVLYLSPPSWGNLHYLLKQTFDHTWEVKLLQHEAISDQNPNSVRRIVCLFLFAVEYSIARTVSTIWKVINHNYSINSRVEVLNWIGGYQETSPSPKTQSINGFQWCSLSLFTHRTNLYLIQFTEWDRIYQYVLGIFFFNIYFLNMNVLQ